MRYSHSKPGEALRETARLRKRRGARLVGAPPAA